MKKIFKIVPSRGNEGNSGRDGVGDGVLNISIRGTGRGKWPGTSENGFFGFPVASLLIGSYIFTLRIMKWPK